MKNCYRLGGLLGLLGLGVFAYFQAAFFRAATSETDVKCFREAKRLVGLVKNYWESHGTFPQTLKEVSGSDSQRADEYALRIVYDHPGRPEEVILHTVQNMESHPGLDLRYEKCMTYYLNLDGEIVAIVEDGAPRPKATSLSPSCLR